METSKKPRITINTVNRTIDKDVTKVNNLTFSYNKREDRVLFIVNHSDVATRIDFFVTRRMMLKLLDAFDILLINECENGKVFKELCTNQEKLVIPIPEQKPISKGNDNKKADEIPEVKKAELDWEKSINTRDLNFTKIKEPIILDSLSYTLNNNSINFKFISQNKTLAASNMTKLTFQRTLSSIIRVIPFMDWGISPHILD